MSWLQQHIAVICMVFGLFSGMLVIVSWGIGYYANALFGMHFELASCWSGVGAIGMGLVGLLKYLTDSSPWNTIKGQIPGSNKSDQ